MIARHKFFLAVIRQGFGNNSSLFQIAKRMRMLGYNVNENMLRVFLNDHLKNCLNSTHKKS